MKYGFSKTVDLPYEQAIEKVTEELKNEGFGVLTAIDVRETLKKKLGVDFPKYTILGACNPPFAHQALIADPEIGLFLPCNLIVYEANGKTIVSAFDPSVLEEIIGNPLMASVADEMKARLERVVSSL